MRERERLMVTFLAVIAAMIWRNETKRREYVDTRLASDKERLDSHDWRAATRRGIVQGVAATIGAVTALALAVTGVIQLLS